MPLQQGYGVVIGTVANHFIEQPDAEGRWPHYHIEVTAPAGTYECVINLKSRSQIRIEYRDFRNVVRSRFASILAKPDGFHYLAPTATSGALDVLRHPGLQNPSGGFPVLARTRDGSRMALRRPEIPCTQWWLESGTNVIELIQYYLLNVHRIYIFGEPYSEGLGVHNVHMNQGDPVGSPFARENGIWQDGGLIVEYRTPQRRLSIFVTKFEAQSLHTNAAGQPM